MFQPEFPEELYWQSDGLQHDSHQGAIDEQRQRGMVTPALREGTEREGRARGKQGH